MPTLPVSEIREGAADRRGPDTGPWLRARRIGIHTNDQAVVFMRTDCDVCVSEGLGARAQLRVEGERGELLATLYHVSDTLLEPGEIGLSEAAWGILRAHEGDEVRISHPEPVRSLSAVRQRIFGHRLSADDFRSIVSDIVGGRYSDVQLATFVTACSSFPLDPRETLDLTRAMIEAGERLRWDTRPILDKHSVGGLPGNRTTPIVVSIVTALGLTMPKTSSRAITSPAGTADAMEVLAPVDLDIAEIRRVVGLENGCIVWGGSVRLSPADDIIIRVERVLDLDPEGQLIASILSKKAAAGASHLIIDMPVGDTAKVRSMEAARELSDHLVATAELLGIRTRVLIGDGRQPIGRGIGPALEARDVLSVLNNQAGAPADLRARACDLAGALLELADFCPAGSGAELASRTLSEGRAWTKFQRICEAQGGMRVPPEAEQRRPLLAEGPGIVDAIDNRRLARLAKLAGAPDVKAAGIEMHVRLGDRVAVGQPLCIVHAASRGELDYAMAYARTASFFSVGDR